MDDKDLPQADREEIMQDAGHIPARDQTFHQNQTSRAQRRFGEKWSGDLEESVKGNRDAGRDLVEDLERIEGAPRTKDDRIPPPRAGATAKPTVADAGARDDWDEEDLGEELIPIHRALLQRKDELGRGIEASRAEVEAIISNANADGHPVDFNHPADLVEGDIDYDKFLQLQKNQQAELRLVEHALERLAAGDYGTCERCEKEIPMARLKALPYARHCIKCQESLDERGGAASEIRL